MIDLLQELEAELKRSAPESAAVLRPGLGRHEIETLLGQLAQPVPEDVRQLYAWHDGTEPTWGSIRAELFTTGEFLPLQAALSIRDAVVENGKWDERWLPVFGDERHYYFHAVVCGTEGGAVVSVSYLDLPDFDFEYPSLRGLVESLVRRWRAGAYHPASGGGIDADYRALAAVRREEDGPGADVDALVKDLVGEEEKLRGTALHRLRSRLYPEAVPALIDALEDPNVTYKWTLIELLGMTGDPQAVPALERTAQNSPEHNYRSYAAKAANAIRSGEEFF